MFSDHLQKIDEVPYKTLLGVAAGLVILCQLIAMVLVVDGQVEKAQVRDLWYASERMAIARCSEGSMGAARQSCIQQARAAGYPSQETYSRQSTKLVANASEIESAAMPIHQVQSFMPAPFATR